MKRTRSFLFALALLTSFQMFAQKEETIVGGRNFGWTGLWGGYKHQLTQFGEETSYINGGFFGFEFGKSLLLGWGRYSLVDEFKWDNIENQDFDMRWYPFLVQYGFKGYKAVHPQLGFEIGRGRVDFGGAKDRILVVQPTAGVEFNVFRWFHLGLDGGYRFVTDSSTPGLSDEDLSGWMAQATLKFGFSWGRYNKKKANNKSKLYED